MGAADILKALAADGVALRLADSGSVKVAGAPSAIDRWLPTIREHKPEILALLRCAAPFDRESWEERAAIAEFDGALSCEEAEALAWREDDRRRCRHCLNLSKAGTCTVASPGGLVFARRGYEPIQDILRRCEGYRPCENDPDQRPGAERWLGLRPVLEGNA